MSLPFARAWTTPAITRSMISDRSRFSRSGQKVYSILPMLVAVSTALAIEPNSTPTRRNSSGVTSGV